MWGGGGGGGGGGGNTFNHRCLPQYEKMKEKRFKTVFCRCSYHTPYNPLYKGIVGGVIRKPTKHGLKSFFLNFFILWQTPVIQPI